ncbi:Transposase [Salinivirga cyanobacteriivorans]|uniref:Transposase n=1 Tax=Salinivirga cyanobacteriivorans TaxID=1307839 RepID=A0A0S2I3H7_9BACT|nr:IS1380 family transposase [Salinivirga cyanobacteriivorans]ALO16863.1 Transposase [Salinivirga cyanobacteriivorans]
MQDTKRRLNSKAGIVKSSFTSSKLTLYSGLNVVAKYMNRQGLIKTISKEFPTQRFNATKFDVNQIMLSVVLASMSGINRMCKISTFTNDGLVRSILKLTKGINENAISIGLKNLGQSGARHLQSLLLSKNSGWLKEAGLESITLDADSTVKSVCGNQQGAAKGFNTTKKGAKSYHPLLVFVSEMKLLYHSWFRTGSAYTSNGICEFLKEVEGSLPKKIKKVFFRADSGFFSGALLDILESFNWDYLIKVKLKNLVKLLEKQSWVVIDKKNNIAICEFEYKAGSWEKARVLKAIRTVKEYVETDFFGISKTIPVYQYACYVSSYNELDAAELHQSYKQRSTSETWIEQVKGQAMAGATLTDDFWANDILWQLSILAYNISVMMRNKNSKFKRQEHRTFVEWFINVPAKMVRSGHVTEIKMYEHHFYKKDWEELDRLVSAA